MCNIECMLTVPSHPPCTQNGASPLYVASQEGHTEVVDMLLSSGADPNLATKVCTALVCSLSYLWQHWWCIPSTMLCMIM